MGLDITKPKPGSVAWVMRLGTSVMINNITSQMLENASPDAERLEILRKLDVHSSMIVPMPFKGKILGAITFLSSDKERSYDETDMNFAKALAIRIGASIDHHYLSEEAKKAFAFKIQQEGMKLDRNPMVYPAAKKRKE